MTSEQIKAKARQLYQERQANAARFDWLHQRKAFLRKVRRLARLIDPAATMDTDPNMAHALMYLDVIATREDIELKLKD